MAQIVTFDPVNLRIIEVNTGLATNSLDLVEIYSEWKDWILSNPQNAGYPPAFRVVGGDPITDTQNLGSTFFLNTGDGWRIRPAEYSHQLEIVGNIFTDPAGQNPYAFTLNPHTVTITNRVSNLTDASVASLDLLALQQAVYINTISGVPGTTNDVGTPTNPVNNIADAYVIATNNNLSSYNIAGTLFLDRDYNNWHFIGGTGPTAIILNGFNVAGSDFQEVALIGPGSGRIDAHNVTLSSSEGLSGVFQDCSFSNTFACADNDFHAFINCVSGVSGSGRPTISFGANSDVAFRNYSGGLELADVTAGCVASCDMAPGDVRLLASCTGGEVLCRGVGSLDDQSTGTTVVDRMVSGPMDPQDLANAIWKADINDYDGLTSEMGGKLLDGSNVTLDPQQLADAVWKGTVADYPDPLTMGGRIIADLATLISAGDSLTPEQQAQLREIWQILGLDNTNPLVVNPTSRVAGASVFQTIQEDVPSAGAVTITKI